MNVRSAMFSRMRAPISRILLGSIIGQGAVLAVSPILTRLYSPSDFGAFAMVTALSAVLGGVVTLSWERAIVIPASDVSAKALLALGMISTVVLSGLVAAAAYFGRSWLAKLLDSQIFEQFWWLVPVTVLSIGVYALFSSWVVRKQQYGRLASRNAVQGLAQAFSSLLLGILNVVPLGLLLSLAVGRVAGLIGLRPRIGSSRAAAPSRAVLWAVLRRYRRFPLINTWSRFSNSLGLQLPIILIIGFYGSFEAGLFALTIRVLAAPIGIVVDAASQYFEGSFANKVRDKAGGLRSFVVGFSRTFLAVGALPALLIVVAGPIVFGFVFGEQWSDSGLYAQVIVLSYLAQFTVAPVSRALVILEWQGTQLAWDVTRATASIGVIVASAALGLDLVWCIAWLGGVQLAAYILLFLLCVRAAHLRDIGNGVANPEH